MTRTHNILLALATLAVLVTPGQYRITRTTPSSAQCAEAN